MFVTLLLPLVIPYGNPCTTPNPKAHAFRKAKFFRWVETVKSDYGRYPNVPLYIFENVEKHQSTLITGVQTPDLPLTP
ncbi:hypothetical protein [Metabacillus sp. Hm71]|uniref:hypothetical protein n=1 Tax=Metabacillus sp. Hm71 TaxID=3450743 RepID=UPI003F42CDE7